MSSVNFPAIRIWQVDAFTDQPFSGNPAAVCVLSGEADANWMQSLAREMNLSETAFVFPEDGEYRLRWMTPESEVDLCGHATLATAHVLYSEGMVPEADSIRFRTRSGTLTCQRNTERGRIEIAMDFPAISVEETSPPDPLLPALGLTNADLIATAGSDLMVVIDDERDLQNLRPDFRHLSEVVTRGVIVTAPATQSDFDFVSRFFAPREGIDEDPATGSAHCALGPYWAKRLDRENLTGRQISRRGGTVRLTVGEDRVMILGQAVTVMVGTLGSAAGPDHSGFTPT